MFFAPLLLAAPIPQATWYVDASAAAPGLGTQSQPYARIDYALAQTSTGNGDVLLIAPGDYIDEAIDFGGKAVLVQSTGGAAVTFLSGLGPGSAQHALVRFVSGEGRQAGLEGFTLRNAPGVSANAAGAVFIEGSMPTLRDLVFEGNLAPGSGSAVYVVNGNPLLDTCTFSGNGGAGCVYGKTSNLELVDCTFQAGAPGTYGGLFLEGGAVTADNCSFLPGPAGTGAVDAAMHLRASDAVVHVHSCQFSGTGVPGRGMYLDGCISEFLSSGFAGFQSDLLPGAAILGYDGDMLAQTCSFSDNQTGSTVGGALALVGCRASLFGCFVTGNQAAGPGQSGGAIYKWGAESLFVTGTYLANNEASQGGAVHVEAGPAFLTDSFFVNNRARAGALAGGEARGGAVSARTSTAIDNCWFSGNQALANLPGGLTDRASGGAVALEGTGLLRNCLFEDNVALAHGEAQGGALQCLSAGIQINRCQFKRCRSEASPGPGVAYGGTLYGPAQLLNVSIIEGFATTGGGGTYGCSLSHVIVHACQPNAQEASTQVRYSLLPTVTPGTGNRVGNPRFWTTNDLHLMPGSPAIDTGIPSCRPIPTARAWTWGR
ncbi:MAG: right-handed parallel beta-helix repeat-containing protein [Planctomycetota bacterium]